MIDSIVLNIPHSSSEFPGTAKDGWENGIDEHIQRWTDWGTDRLFGMASSMDPRIHPVTFPWSRFFCDVERLENDPLEKIGHGIVYSSFEGIGRNLTGTEIIYRSYYLGHKAATRFLPTCQTWKYASASTMTGACRIKTCCHK